MSLPGLLQANPVRDLLGNPILVPSLTSWILAQIIKSIVAFITAQKKSFLETMETVIWRTGGMPSSHAAVVCSVTTAAGISEGLASNLFAVCFFFAMVVMRDALGVRRSAGLQAKALNELGRNASDRIGFEYRAVKEIQGHTPSEVIIGSLLGVLVALAFALLGKR